MANPQIDQVLERVFSKLLPLFIIAGLVGGLGALIPKKRSRSRSPSGGASGLGEALVLLPWWVSFVLAFIAYLILRALLPAAIAQAGLPEIVALGLIALALLSAIRSWKTAQMLEEQTGIESIRALPWKRFEDLLAEAYRRRGYQVTETLGTGADGGIDLVLRCESEIILVQCKRWTGKLVPVQTVRELYGLIHDQGATGANLVATTEFTSDAIAFAEGKPIQLVNAEGLLELLRGVQTLGRIVHAAGVSAERRGDKERDHLTPVCPSCGAIMVFRRARRGPNAGSSFWGCPSFPRCKGTRSL